MAPVRDRRPGFSRRRQYGVFLGYVLAVAGAVVGAALLLISTFQPPLFAGFRMTAATLTAPVSSILATGVRGVAGVSDMIASYFAVRSRNQVMAAQLKQQAMALTRARAIAYDNRRLRALLQLRDRSSQVVATARLVSSTASSGRRFALLNAGWFAGVRPGMPVRGPVGLIGRIVETGPNAARVLLVVDAESVVPVRRTRDGVPAIAAGRGDGAIDIRSVYTTNVRFRAGDMFVTSGTGGLYAPGVPVARVAKTGNDTVEARPFARPETLDFAMVEQPFMPVPIEVGR